MILNKQGMTNKERADFIVKANELGYTVTEYATHLVAREVVKTPEEIRVEIDNLTMTKGEFLTLAINLSALVGQPISLEEIEGRIFAKDEQGKYLTPDIAFLFSYATTVKRGDAMMEQVTTDWGYPVELLDIMFTQKDELLRKIAAGEPLEMPQ